jgi:hypothetical protein
MVLASTGASKVTKVDIEDTVAAAGAGEIAALSSSDPDPV